MQQIPRLQSEDREITQLQNNIIQVVNPVLKQNPILFGSAIKGVTLGVGNNTVSTGLSDDLQGWIVIRKRSNANIYDVQDSNSVRGTLILNSDAAVVIDLLVF